MSSLGAIPRQSLRLFSRSRPVQNSLQGSQIRSNPTFTSPQLQLSTQTRQIHTNYRRSILPKFRIGRKAGSPPSRSFATATASSGESLSLSQRLKKLSREYGWSALGVYFLLSALDFPFCFLAVRLLGTDRIGHWEHVVVSTVKDWVKWPLSSGAQETVDGAVQEVQTAVQDVVPIDEVRNDGTRRILEEDNTYVVADHGYKEAAAANAGANASLWTQLALAYAIHKSFIFIRVPLTAAVTPKVVKTLRSWGWNIGKRPAKTPAVSSSATSKSGVNTKGTGVKSD